MAHENRPEDARPIPTLEDTIGLAARAHQGQGYPTSELRREPFILHPLRVMLRLHVNLERIVALLHDSVEDTENTLADLHGLGYSDEVVEAVDRLTRRSGESYEHYIDRLATNPLARRVKLADLEDNLANNRGVDSDTEERARIERYERTQSRLRAMEERQLGSSR